MEQLRRRVRRSIPPGRRKGALKHALFAKRKTQQKTLPCTHRNRVTQNYLHESTRGQDVRKKYNLQPLGNNEKYIDYCSNKIEFLAAIIGQVEAGWKRLDKVRALVAENGA